MKHATAILLASLLLLLAPLAALGTPHPPGAALHTDDASFLDGPATPATGEAGPLLMAPTPEAATSGSALRHSPAHLAESASAPSRDPYSRHDDDDDGDSDEDEDDGDDDDDGGDEDDDGDDEDDEENDEGDDDDDNGGDSDDEVEAEGVIEELGADYLVVAGLTFLVDDATEVFDDDGTPILFSDLVPGLFVEVEADVLDDGTLLAHTIEVEDEDDEGDEVEVEGFIEELGADFLVVDGLTFLVDDATEVRGEDGASILFGDLTVGTFVEVEADVLDDGTLLAREIEVETDGLEIGGTVEELGADFLVVDGLTLFVDDATEIYDDDGTPILFSDLVPGLFVTVEAEQLPDGSLLANLIQIESDGEDDDGEGDDEDEDGRDDDDEGEDDDEGDDDEGDDEVEVEGFIEELGADFLVVDGLTFLVDDATEVRGEDDEPILFGDLTVGTFVEVEADVLDDGRLRAREIEVDEPEDEDEDEFEITGLIEEIGADFLVVNTLTFRVDDATLVLDDDDRVIRFADLGVGLLVEVHAAPLPDGTLLALEIELEDAEDDEVEITGTIEAIGPGALVVGGVPFTVTDATLVLDDDDQPLPFAVLALGMLVEVEAETGPDGRLFARRIEVEDRIEDEVAVTGVAERIAEDAVGVLGRSFRLLPRTEVFDAAGNALSPAALRIGQTLAVRGDLLPGGTLVALRIAVQEAPAFRVLGPVEAAGGGTLSVLGVDFFLDAATVFLDAAGNPASADDVAEGRTVVVEGEGRTDGTRRAATVRLEDVTVAAGRLDAVGAGTLTLAGLTVTLDAQTLVRGPDNAPLPAAALAAGQRAEVRAVQRGTATVATKIRLLETRGTPVAAEDDAPSVPAAFVLHGNYPNPFNPQTTIAFELKTPQAVSLVVYDAAGRAVVRLVEGPLGAGVHRVVWDGRNEQGRMAASGVYLYRLRAGDRAEARTMLLVK